MQKKLYNVLYTIFDGPCIEAVDLTDRDYHHAFDPRAFIRSSGPNTPEAYVERVHLFTDTNEIGLVIYRMSPQRKVRINRSTPYKWFRRNWGLKVLIFNPPQVQDGWFGWQSFCCTTLSVHQNKKSECRTAQTDHYSLPSRWQCLQKSVFLHLLDRPPRVLK